MDCCQVLSRVLIRWGMEISGILWAFILNYDWVVTVAGDFEDMCRIDLEIKSGPVS